MALGPAHDIWGKLYAALRALAEGTGGSFAFVVDQGNGLWCVGLKDTPPTIATTRENEAADRFYRDELIPRLSALRRGERIEIVRGDIAAASASEANASTDCYIAISFAAIYVIVVWFEAPFAAPFARARIKRALPEIEALMLSMPPWGGPGTDAGAGKARA